MNSNPDLEDISFSSSEVERMAAQLMTETGGVHYGTATVNLEDIEAMLRGGQTPLLPQYSGAQTSTSMNQMQSQKMQPTQQPIQHVAHQGHKQQYMSVPTQQAVGETFAQIIEQPRSRGLRFRYECEGRAAGSIPGENSSAQSKTFPSLQIHNHHGAAVVVVSCVTKDESPKPHPHNLVGKDCGEGVCTVKVKDASNLLTFPQLGIQCAKKKDVEGELKKREKIRVDPFQTGFKHKKSSIDLSVVRLCFQVFLPDNKGKFTRILKPVVSQPIYDKKSISELAIVRCDRHAGSAGGGDEVFILCDKVNKDDIEVRFYQEDQDGVCWEGFGVFGQGDVHRQVAIVFKTPEYKDRYLQKPVQVQMQLRRPSDKETSEPRSFQYIPNDIETVEAKRKRKTVHSYFTDSMKVEAAATNVKAETDQQKGEIRDRLIKKAQRGLHGNSLLKQENTGLPSCSFTQTSGTMGTAATTPFGQVGFGTSIPGQQGISTVIPSSSGQANLQQQFLNPNADPSAFASADGSIAKFLQELSGGGGGDNLSSMDSFTLETVNSNDFQYDISGSIGANVNVGETEMPPDFKALQDMNYQ